jgi:hypothetical protein
VRKRNDKLVDVSCRLLLSVINFKLNYHPYTSHVLQQQQKRIKKENEHTHTRAGRSFTCSVLFFIQVHRLLALYTYIYLRIAALLTIDDQECWS